MGFLLTNAEISDAVHCAPYGGSGYDQNEVICRAQMRKVFEEMKKDKSLGLLPRYTRLLDRLEQESRVW